ncbi:MAG: hypothetical protein CHACPFDD_02355 [Phycisphaerae bacterium]|nr:hypothetical protein [Phycisphaerae bacterium]
MSRILVAVALMSMASAAAQTLGTLDVDSVELVAGREVAGQPEIAHVHGGYRYLFASRENLATFQRQPEKFEIQLGGACARMGALSGLGSTGIRTVFKDRIYIFASEACKKGFLSGPEKLLDSDDPVPTGSDDDRATARQLLDKAVAALGGAERLSKVRSYARRMIREQDYQGRKVKVGDAWTIAVPDRLRRDSIWDTSSWSFVATPDDAFTYGERDCRGLSAAGRVELQRLAVRDPLMLLLSRSRADFVAVAGGRVRVGERDAERVIVHFQGCATTLAIDEASGRIVGCSFRGRGASLRFGKVELVYSEFTEVSGITLPMHVAATFDGKPFDDATGTISEARINAELAADTFARPKP